jgi:hypothetical protein
MAKELFVHICYLNARTTKLFNIHKIELKFLHTSSVNGKRTEEGILLTVMQ